MNTNKNHVIVDDLKKVFRVATIFDVDRIDLNDLKNHYNLPKKFICYQTDEDIKNKTMTVKVIY